MTAYNHLIVITQRHSTTEALVAILNTSNAAQMRLGWGNSSLWILPNCKKNSEEASKRLEEVADIQKVRLVSISKPTNESEIKKVRKMLNEFELDTESISDHEFRLYLNCLIDRKFDYYIDFVYGRLPEQPPKLVIKLLKDHPEFSPEWLEEKPSPIENDGDHVYTIDDFVTIHETFDETIDAPFNEDEDVLPPGDK